MSSKGWLILLPLCLAACAGEQPYDHHPVQIQGRPGLMYAKGDGREAIACGNGATPTECGSVEISGIAEQAYLDCSDERFACVFNTADVLAVPKAGMTEGEEYAAFGAKLKVERCFGDQTSCEIALISSECADAEVCNCRSAVPHRTTRFYFSRELGVTAFYTIGDPAAVGVNAKMLTDAIPLLTYVLVAKKGFLRAPLALSMASLNCRK